MKDVAVRQLEMAIRVVGFFQATPIAFRKGSSGTGLVERLQQQVAEIQSLTATQASEIAQSRAYSRARGAARESLNTAMGRINRTARAMAITVPELEARFEMENKLGDNMALQLKWENVRHVERRWIYKTPKEETPLRPAA